MERGRERESLIELEQNGARAKSLPLEAPTRRAHLRNNMDEDHSTSSPPGGSHGSHQSPPSAARLALQALQEIGTPSMGTKTTIVSPEGHYQDSPLTFSSSRVRHSAARLEVVGIGLGLGGGSSGSGSGAASVAGTASAVDEGSHVGAGGGAEAHGRAAAAGHSSAAVASGDVVLDVSNESSLKANAASSVGDSFAYRSQHEIYALARTPPHTGGGGGDGVDPAGSAQANVLTFAGADSIAKRAGGDRDSGRVSIGSIDSAPRIGRRGHSEFPAPTFLSPLTSMYLFRRPCPSEHNIPTTYLHLEPTPQCGGTAGAAISRMAAASSSPPTGRRL